jgi:hypothetical protein
VQNALMADTCLDAEKFREIVPFAPHTKLNSPPQAG